MYGTHFVNLSFSYYPVVLWYMPLLCAIVIRFEHAAGAV